MKSAPVNIQEVLSHSLRLDPEIFLGTGRYVNRVLSNFKFLSLDELLGSSKSKIYKPSSNSIVRMPRGIGVPYIPPGEILSFLPLSFESIIYTKRTKKNDLQTLVGEWLVTCSGRNLGNSVYVDNVLGGFAISPDTIRVTGTKKELTYAMAFLLSRPGIAVMRCSMTGSVIDHLSPNQLSNMKIPILDSKITNRVVGLIDESNKLVEHARLSIINSLEKYEQILGIDKITASYGSTPRVFSKVTSSCGLRLDPEYHAPHYKEIREQESALGFNQKVRDFSTLTRPATRMKLHRTKDDLIGIPYLSSEASSQFVIPRITKVLPGDINNIGNIAINPNELLISADGRAEKALGDIYWVPFERSGWLSSGHLIRAKPLDGVDIGLLYLAFKTHTFQTCVRSLATGSVVDGLSISDIYNEILSYPKEETQELKLCSRDIIASWEKFSRARELRNNACREFEKQLGIDEQLLDDKNFY